MIGALTLYQTTIGKKVIMAVSGLILFAYVVVHMLGNLKIFQGRDYINAYGVFLREVGGPLFGHEQVLWIARIILLAAVGLHIWAAYELTRLDLASRPVNYAMRKNRAYGYAVRTLRWGGVIIAFFIIYHILHLTTGTAHPRFVEGDVYNNVVVGFQNPLVSLFYIVAQLALALHLYHGAWSMFQTLGLNNSRNRRFWRGFATFFSVTLAVGNISIPVAVMLGLLRL